MVKIIGYTTGVFDMFHIGHLNLLKKANDACDHLIVGVTTDELSVSVKNKKPIIPFEERLQIVSCIRYVDQAVPQFSYDKLEAYHKYKFHKMFVGDDWKGSQKWNELEHSFKSEGVEIIYFPYTKGRSSTSLRAKLTGTEVKTLKLT